MFSLFLSLNMQTTNNNKTCHKCKLSCDKLVEVPWQMTQDKYGRESCISCKHFCNNCFGEYKKQEIGSKGSSAWDLIKNNWFNTKYTINPLPNRYEICNEVIDKCKKAIEILDPLVTKLKILESDHGLNSSRMFYKIPNLFNIKNDLDEIANNPNKLLNNTTYGTRIIIKK